MSTYIDTPAANRAIFDKFIIELSLYFPDYILEKREDHWNCKFIHKNDSRKGFYISPDHYKGKMNVSTRYYRNNKSMSETELYVNGNRVPSISCGFSYTRDAESVAIGIKKRFMPEFEANYILVLDKWKNEDDYNNAHQNALKDICAALGIDTPNERSNSREIVHTYQSTNENLKNIISSVRVSSGDSIKIELNYLNKSQVLRIIDMIKNLE